MSKRMPPGRTAGRPGPRRTDPRDRSTRAVGPRLSPPVHVSRFPVPRSAPVDSRAMRQHHCVPQTPQVSARATSFVARPVTTLPGQPGPGKSAAEGRIVPEPDVRLDPTLPGNDRKRAVASGSIRHRRSRLLRRCPFHRPNRALSGRVGRCSRQSHPHSAWRRGVTALSPDAATNRHSEGASFVVLAA